MSEDFDLKVFRAYPQGEPPVGTVDKGPIRKAVVTGIVFLFTLLTISILGTGAVLFFSFARDKDVQILQTDLKSLQLSVAKLDSVLTKAGAEGWKVNLKQRLGDDMTLVDQFEAIAHGVKEINETIITYHKELVDLSTTVERVTTNISNRISSISSTVSTISNRTSSISGTVSTISSRTSSFDSLVSTISSTVSTCTCPYHTIRLVNSSGFVASNSGRLEVCHNGRWGTVCDDKFDNTDATVACKMLGYRSGVAKSGAFYGEGTGPIWIDNLSCRSTHADLFSCRHGGLGNTDCTHAEDAGVICS